MYPIPLMICFNKLLPWKSECRVVKHTPTHTRIHTHTSCWWSSPQTHNSKEWVYKLQTTKVSHLTGP